MKIEESDGVWNPDLVILRLARSNRGVDLYVKSPALQVLFKSLADGRTTPTINNGWGLEMKQWDLNTILSSQVFDTQGEVNFDDPDSYVPANLNVSLVNWRTENTDSRSDNRRAVANSDKLLINPFYNWEDKNGNNIGHGVPNLSFLLSDELENGFHIKLNSVLSNRGFDLYFSMVERYLKWLCETTSIRQAFLRIHNDENMTVESMIGSDNPDFDKLMDNWD